MKVLSGKKSFPLPLYLSTSLPLLFFLLFLSPSLSPQSSDQYLLMQPIETAVRTGDFSGFKAISQPTVAVHFEAPFDLRGYLPIDKFADTFTPGYARYKTETLEWSSKQIEENYAVQSLNVILKDSRTEQDLYYKFIFFMKKKNTQWKIYYLRGLRI